MHQTLEIGNVHNMSLENVHSHNSDRPPIVVQFSCETKVGGKCSIVWAETDALDMVCCAAVQLYDSWNVTLKGIHITSQAPGMSGIIVQNVKHEYSLDHNLLNAN